MVTKKVPKRNRDQLPVMVDFVDQIERELEDSAFDLKRLRLTTYEARHHASRLKGWLSELDYLVNGD